MKILASIAILATLLLFGAAFAQASDNHTVTVTVLPIHAISIDQDVTLVASTPNAGSDFTSVTNSDATITWTTNAANRKITVNTGGLQPLYNLSVVAIAPTAGSDAGTVAIDGTARDFLTGVGKTFGSATLEYSIDPTVVDDPNSQSYVIFYTMTGV